MEFNKALEIDKRCRGCKYAQRIYANDGWSFTGCKHEPYRGTWIIEIEECPKERRTDEKL